MALSVPPDTFRSPDFGLVGYVVGGQPTSYRTSLRRHTTLGEFDVKDMPVTVAVDSTGGAIHRTGPATWKVAIEKMSRQAKEALPA